jgi:hypothetical protein
MKDELEKDPDRSLTNWVEKIHRIWDVVVPTYLESLIESMPRRIEACIAAKGDEINY